MSLSDLSIRRPVFAWMLMLALVLFGMLSYRRLGVSQLPDVTFPYLSIYTVWPGAAPEVLEKEVADPIEEAMIGLQGIKSIDTQIVQGRCEVGLKFVVERDIDAALQEANSRLRALRLPDGADKPLVFKYNQSDDPIMWLSCSSDMPTRDLIRYIDLHIRDKFQVIPGVANLQVAGWARRNLRVHVDLTRLQQYELTVSDVRDALHNENRELSAGSLENDRQELLVRTMGEGVTPEQIAQIPISTRNGQRIYRSKITIGDVARIEDGLSDMRELSRSLGLNTVGLGIQKQHNYNEVKVSDAVLEKVKEINPTLPPGMKIKVNYDSAQFTRLSFTQTMTSLIEAALVTSLVCWFFLGSFRSTLNVLIAIPTSILGTFLVMDYMGFTLNFFSLLGLSLAIGIVVDDAIMVLENIARHHHMGKGPRQAASDGANEISFAASAATVAVIAVFVPVLFLKGIVGQFLFQFGVTICTAVALSLLEAITLTPMRCSRYMTAKDEENRLARWMNARVGTAARWYGSILQKLLRHRWKVLVISLLLFGASLGLATKLRYEFSPAQDIGFAFLRMDTPAGSSLSYTASRIAVVEEWLMKHEFIKDYYLSAGSQDTGGGVNSAIAYVTLADHDKRRLSQKQVLEIMRKDFKDIPDLKVFVLDPSQNEFSERGSKIELVLRGPEMEVLRQASEEIIKDYQATGVMTDIDSDFRRGAEEIHLLPNRAAISAAQLSLQEVNAVIEAALGGVKAGKFSSDGRRYDVFLRLEAEQRRTLDQIRDLKVQTVGGRLIPLSDLVQIVTEPKLTTIKRHNRERSIKLYANTPEDKSVKKVTEQAFELARKHLPEGYSAEKSGASESNDEGFETIGVALIGALLVAYMVLAIQFNSFVHPFTVMMTLPFSLTGALLALFVTNNSVNLYSAIGIVLLMGIVTKNGILLVEFFNQQREHHGLSLNEAILHGGPVRLRPIVMTTMATIAAALPPALSHGAGSETRIPLALTIIGGVTVSTLFTLVVVPCLYSLMSGLERRRRPELEWLHTRGQDVAPAV